MNKNHLIIEDQNIEMLIKMYIPSSAETNTNKEEIRQILIQCLRDIISGYESDVLTSE